MRLFDLSPQFVSLVRTVGAAGAYERCDSIEQADGVRFLCPKCFAERNSPIGVHAVVCWKPSVLPKVRPAGRWGMTGTGMYDLTLVPAALAVKTPADCQCRFSVKNGEVTFVV